MANIITTYQQINTFSVNRQAFLEAIVFNELLTENDLRVACLLLTQLNGFRYEKVAHMKDGRERRSWNNDPKNFKNIDIKKMAKSLHLSKKDVKKSIDRLIEEAVIEKGSSDTIKDGYRFLF